jgi:hypothetical protein
MKSIAYKGGYKHQLKETYCVTIDIKPVTAINSDYIDLGTEGVIDGK